MARIAGVDLPKNKRVEIGLTYIYGIGRTTSKQILEKLNIHPDTKTDDLTESEANDIRKLIDGFNVRTCPREGAICLPLAETAREQLGRELFTNIVTLGALARVTGVVSR